MSGVRVLVGTRKGAFVLTSDGKRERWDVNGPFFGGWEMYHLKGSPADPNRIVRVAIIWLVRADDPALERRRQDVGTGRATSSSTTACPARISGTTERRTRGNSNACGTSSHRSPIRIPSMPASKMRRSFARPTVVRTGGNAGASRPRLRSALGTRRRWPVPSHDPARSVEPAADVHRDFSRRRVSHRRRRDDVAANQQGLHSQHIPNPTAEVGHCVHRLAMHRSRPSNAVHAEALGRDAHR